MPQETVFPLNLNTVCIAGVGAIGGILASMLCRAYPGKVALIARGERAKALREHGAVMHSEFYGEVEGRPGRIVPDGRDLELQDLIFVCVKNYSLDSIAESIAPCVGPETVIVPAVNGVEAGDRMRRLFPQAIVCDSVMYTTTGANPDGSVTQNGAYTHMFIGAPEGDRRAQEAAERVAALLTSARFDARPTREIRKEIWGKFLLNCAFNTITARYLVCNGDIRRSEQMQKDAYALLSETYAVSCAEGVGLPEDMPDQKIRFILSGQSEKATSSLRRDVEAHRPAEIDAFSGAVIRKAHAYGIPVPVTERYHRELTQIIDSYTR